jgi:alkylhydroperoxidase/carboxymuconolactone decarboxylase family protein YurZ/ADP-ribose pyrophosphatase YjhB (NUDIX family)
VTIDHHDSVCAWTVRDRSVLLVRNERRIGGARVPTWDLPGGRVEPGESLPAALQREWAEEVGPTSIDVIDLVYLEDGTVRDVEGGPARSTWRTLVFAVHATDEPGGGALPLRWVPIGDLEHHMTAPYHAGLLGWRRDPSRRHATVEWIDPTTMRPAGAPLTALLRLVAAGAVGDAPTTAVAARDARHLGASSAAIEEALLLLAPYAGFPRTIAAFQAAAPHLDTPRGASEAAPPADAAAAGARCFGAVYGETAARIHEGLAALHPALATWIREFAYGRVLGREGALSLLERELLAAALLTAMGGLEAPLLGHLRAARRLGAAPADLAAAVDAATHTAPRWALHAAQRLLERVPDPPG